MKKLLILSLIISGVCSAQTFDPLSLQKMPQQRILGRTGPTTGNATFIKLSADFLIRNDSLLYVGSSTDTANAFVNYITRLSGVDSIYFNIGGTWYAILDSTGGAGGGVSSVATNNGTGITGGTITTTGTLAIDTTNVISTRLQLQHRIDSLAAAISGASAAGNNRNIQFNNLGAFDGNDSLQWAAGRLNVLGQFNVGITGQGILWDNSSRLKITGTSNSGFSITQGAHEWLFYMGAGGTGGFGIYDVDAALDRMVIDAAGKVGIGTASPTARLHLSAGTATANTAPLKFTTGTSLTAAEAGAMEYTTPQLFFTNGGAIRQEIPQIQQTMVVTQFDKTSNTTLGNVTNLTADLAAGKTYRFEARLYTSSGSSGGVKAAIGGTATATTIVYEGLTTDAGTTTQSRATALGTAVGAVTAVTAGYIVITGSITTDAAGTLTVQFAQNASDAATSSVLWGSTFVVTQINY